jgi:hypothetical protein
VTLRPLCAENRFMFGKGSRKGSQLSVIKRVGVGDGVSCCLPTGPRFVHDLGQANVMPVFLRELLAK